MSAEPLIETPHGRDAQESKKERLAREALERQCRLADLQWVIDDPRGRRFVRYLLVDSGVFNTSFNQNAMEFARAEGRKSYGTKLLELIEEHFPNQYLALKREVRAERDEFNRKRASDRNPKLRSDGE